MRNKHQHGPGFRQMTVSNIYKESDSVTSFILSAIELIFRSLNSKVSLNRRMLPKKRLPAQDSVNVAP